MASVSTTNKINSASTLRGYGGLASGLDRDSLIEGMTAATRAKIAKQKQGRQTLLWKQEGYQSISSKLVEFSKKYTSYVNPKTNLSSASFWAKNSITTNGVNSKYVSVTGSSSISESISIVGVKQLAKDATALSSKEVSNGKITTGDINLGNEMVSTLEGGYLTFEYGNKSYNVTLNQGADYDYSNGKRTVDSIVKSLDEISIGNGKTLANVIEVTADPSDENAPAGTSFKLNMKSKDVAGNKLEITGGSEGALKAIGFDNLSVLPDALREITKDGFYPLAQNRQTQYESKSFAERVGDKAINFTYNGSSKSISFASKTEIEGMIASAGGDDNKALLSIVANMQKKIDNQFGAGRISVGVQKDGTNNQLTFDTVTTENFSFKSEASLKRLADKEISFTYQGITKDIKIPQSEIDDIIKDSNGNMKNAMESIVTSLNTKLESEFGSDKIKVQLDSANGEYKILFEGDAVDDNKVTATVEDKSSILTLSYADSGVLGKNGAIKLASDSTNRLDMNSTLSNSGLSGIPKMDVTYYSAFTKALEIIKKSSADDGTTIDAFKALISDEKYGLSVSDIRSITNAINNQIVNNPSVNNVGDLKTEMEKYVSDRQLELKINGKPIEGLSYNDSINDIIDKINKSDAGVKVSYIKGLDKFSFASTISGSSGSIKITGGAAEQLFGKEGTDYDVTNGQDAIVSIKYAGSAKEVELVRGSNIMNVDGLNITVSGTFGYNQDTLDPTTDPVTLSAKTNSEQIMTAVTDMIKDFNEIVKNVNDQVSTKPNRDYKPLTDEQKSSMSEDQIKTWEEKAKVGMLFNDSDLRTLADSLRFIFEAGSEDKAKLASFGISTSSDYTDKGKLVLDEAKFLAALEKNSEEVQSLFIKKSDSIKGEKDGFMAKLTSITNKYASTSGATKGILIEKAGSIYAPTSMLSNNLKNSIDSIDKFVKRLQTQLKTETDRYVKQFTNLENVIAQMNSQSSTLSSFGG